MFLAGTAVAHDGLTEYTCGSLGQSFSGTFPYTVHLIVLIIQVAIPILLVILGMLDLGKAVAASKEDEIKKGQQMFVKRLVAAILVFFVIFVVKIVVKFASSGDNTVMNCMNCFLHAKVEENDTGCIEFVDAN